MDEKTVGAVVRTTVSQTVLAASNRVSSIACLMSPATAVLQQTTLHYSCTV